LRKNSLKVKKVTILPHLTVFIECDGIKVQNLVWVKEVSAFQINFPLHVPGIKWSYFGSPDYRRYM
jgi:hypothetical protein